MHSRPNLTPDRTASSDPDTPSSTGGAHIPLTPPSRPSHTTRHHPAALAGLATVILALLAILAAGVVRGSEDMVSTGVIGLLATISCATAPWVTARAATPASTTKEHSRA
ncbi:MULTISPECIES: hypothetical protein [unclassified Actinomyces]|uniref:hypothetical protein n=1 Tax=unclassified Actinomyces TaxID=2609248 RepID=UPI0011BDBB3C|nr:MULTISPECIES: hypothetical protein [unclassified Actinomyces]